MIQARVKLVHPGKGDRHFVGQTGSGHHVCLDDTWSGPKPIELVALALAGCTAFDVVTILRKKRQVVKAYEVAVEAEQPPQVFQHVRIHHKVSGDVDQQALAAAIALSDEKYCSVGAMVRHTCGYRDHV